VWIVEGSTDGRSPRELGSFHLDIDRAGWTLSLTAIPTIERRWLWSSIAGFTTAACGHTPDGRPATSVDAIVDGWPVRLLVPSEELVAPAAGGRPASRPGGTPSTPATGPRPPSGRRQRRPGRPAAAWRWSTLAACVIVAFVAVTVTGIPRAAGQPGPVSPPATDPPVATSTPATPAPAAPGGPGPQRAVPTDGPLRSGPAPRP